MKEVVMLAKWGVEYVVARNLTQEKAESLRDYVFNTNEESDGRYFADLFITDVVIR